MMAKKRKGMQDKFSKIAINYKLPMMISEHRTRNQLMAMLAARRSRLMRPRRQAVTKPLRIGKRRV